MMGWPGSPSKKSSMWSPLHLAAFLFWLFSAANPKMALAAHAPGPDAFGYTAQATTQFSFTQITNNATARIWAGNDDAATNVSLGFAFNFYGTNYANISFNLNGLMMFGAPSGDFSNIDLTLSS